ncbi:MAG: nitroreductase family protein [Oscillospiraceae bacterium]|nr:nitroreductase family protein [Oscillospiraceae bacterium]
MRPQITFSEDLCIKCGQCAANCPTHHISMEEDGPVSHHNRRCLQCMHCAAVCPRKAIHFEHVPAYAEYPETPEDETLKLIMTRRSVRHFKPDAPEADDITWALDMAQWAPSGKNRHLTQWLVVHSKEKCDAVYNYVCDVTAETGVMPALAQQRAKGNHDSVTCGCSTIIMALAPDEGSALTPESGETDAVIAMATAELLLNKIGLGTCWGGYLTFFSNQLPQLREYLKIPAGYHIAGTLLCGIPDEVYHNIPYRPNATVHWL